MKIVPIVLGSNQCNFTVLSPNSRSWEPSMKKQGEGGREQGEMLPSRTAVE